MPCGRTFEASETFDAAMGTSLDVDRSAWAAIRASANAAGPILGVTYAHFVESSKLKSPENNSRIDRRSFCCRLLAFEDFPNCA